MPASGHISGRRRRRNEAAAVTDDDDDDDAAAAIVVVETRNPEILAVPDPSRRPMLLRTRTHAPFSSFTSLYFSRMSSRFVLILLVCPFLTGLLIVRLPFFLSVEILRPSMHIICMYIMRFSV